MTVRIEFGNSSAQDFALAAKSVKISKLGQGNLPLAEGDLEWADSVTGKPKVELLRNLNYPVTKHFTKYRTLCYPIFKQHIWESEVLISHL